MERTPEKYRDLTISKYFPHKQVLSALNDSEIGVVICDRELRYRFVNSRVAETHNCPRQALIGKRMYEALGALARAILPHWEDVFATGNPLSNVEISGKLPMRAVAGRWIENFFPILDRRGRVLQVGCFVLEVPPPLVLQDIAERRPSGQSRPVSQPHVLPANADVPQYANLSPREQEVLRLLAEGKSNKEASALLALSVRTVETYRFRIMLKLRATSFAQLVHYAIRNQIVEI